MKGLSKRFLENCKQKLADMRKERADTLNGLTGELVRETAGDPGDQARQLQEETISLARRQKLEAELHEIDEALHRIKENTYGVCEETGNVIEEKRLNAIPWTRLSLEGAEIREMEKEEESA